MIERMRDMLWYGYAALLVLVLAARAVRGVIESRGRTVRITYPGGREVAAPVGITVLEASRMAGIAHASVCGGRGRCSTCRIRVIGGLEDLPPAAPAERRVLDRIAAPPNVRLASQLRPEGGCPCCRFSPRMRRRARARRSRGTRRARSGRARCCSPTSAASRASRRGNSPTTWCSS
ncbi:MAG: 2Fe-2S iron-sulfur cluster-binding protein [Nitrospinota bacterium]